MYITPITNYSFTGTPLRILAGANKDHQYLYNEVLNIVRKEKIGANFHSTKIELPEPTKQVIEKLNALNIKYEPITKQV